MTTTILETPLAVDDQADFDLDIRISLITNVESVVNSTQSLAGLCGPTQSGCHGCSANCQSLAHLCGPTQSGCHGC